MIYILTKTILSFYYLNIANFNVKMINADKYKKNKFRKLVPTSNSDTDKLQKLTTAEHQNETTSSQLTISQ